MHLLVETNFLVELILGQEQAAACEKIVAAAEQEKLVLHVPSFSLMEQLYRLTAVSIERDQLQGRVEKELKAAERETTDNSSLVQLKREFATVFAERSVIQQERMFATVSRISRTARIIPLLGTTWALASELNSTMSLTLPDAVVSASLLLQLEDLPAEEEKLFVSRDHKAFRQEGVKQLFKEKNCGVLLNFDDTVQKLRLV